jgi:hypothetical protein
MSPAPVIREIQATGASLRQIAAALNDRHIPTARGSGWTATQVLRVLGLEAESRAGPQAA